MLCICICIYIYIYIYTHIHNFSRSYTIYNGHDRVNVCPFVLHARMNEWIMHLYSTLLCIVVHPKRFTIMWGVSPQPPPSVQHPLGWCDGCHRTTAPVRSPHTSYRWRGERVMEPIKCMHSPHTSYRWRGERVIEPIKWMGMIKRPWLTRASGGNLARTPGLHPYSLREVPWEFLWPRSQDLGLTSHLKDGAFWQYSVPVTILRR